MFSIGDHEIKLTGTQDGLLMWPEEWTRELTERGFIDVAVRILAAMPPCATRVPWIIGSASKTLLGRERTESQSHMQGKAFDMSPMYSATEILAPDDHIMGLAWNIVSLSIIAWAYNDYPCFVVEGDHLHVQPDVVMQKGTLPVAFTMPTWYQWTTELSSSEQLDSLNGSFWVFDYEEPSMRLATRDEMTALMAALRV